ncbi:hypothetical protein [Flavobacterium sp. I3-2]|uniref:hypothetical protein n=1 Tax=Flavobacterium sp. I3-2 TaxID=2748319 RepID=UPI0015A9BAC0|nr:hypothetical protein [Flavobacterium sp. I3-2]
MKIYYILTFFVSFTMISCNSSTSNSLETKVISENQSSLSSDFDDKIEKIRANFKRINSIKNWTVIDSVELYNSTEGGQAKFYFANKQLQKIEAVYYGESGKAVVEYYLLESKLSFVFRKEFRYNRPIYWNESGDEKFDLEKSKIFETRSYFYKDSLFEQIKSSEEKKEILNNNLEKEQQSIKADFNELKQLSLVRQI